MNWGVVSAIVQLIVAGSLGPRNVSGIVTFCHGFGIFLVVDAL